jgi:REP element-mobilizing transposase RayT
MFEYGKVARRHIENMKNFYSHITIDKYIIMPNHIHFLIQIHNVEPLGPSGTPVPTNSYIANLMSTFKRFCNKDIGKNIWQYRSYDHIIRGEGDYLKIWNYIDTNPQKWREDCFYCE